MNLTIKSTTYNMIWLCLIREDPSLLFSIVKIACDQSVPGPLLLSLWEGGKMREQGWFVREFTTLRLPLSHVCDIKDTWYHSDNYLNFLVKPKATLNSEVRRKWWRFLWLWILLLKTNRLRAISILLVWKHGIPILWKLKVLKFILIKAVGHTGELQYC